MMGRPSSAASCKGNASRIRDWTKPKRPKSHELGHLIRIQKPATGSPWARLAEPRARCLSQLIQACRLTEAEYLTISLSESAGFILDPIRKMLRLNDFFAECQEDLLLRRAKAPQNLRLHLANRGVMRVDQQLCRRRQVKLQRALVFVMGAALDHAFLFQATQNAADRGAIRGDHRREAGLIKSGIVAQDDQRRILHRREVRADPTHFFGEYCRRMLVQTANEMAWHRQKVSGLAHGGSKFCKLTYYIDSSPVSMPDNSK